MTLERRGAKDVSVWDTDDAKRYAAAKHGPDGARFLDPHLYALLSPSRIGGSDFLDLGAGAGPWSKYALEQGARTVTAVEIRTHLINH